MLVNTQEKMEKRKSQLEQKKFLFLQKRYRETLDFKYISLMDRLFGNVDFLETDWGNEYSTNN